MLKRNFVLLVLFLLVSAVYINYRPQNIVEDMSIDINNGIDLSLVNENNEVEAPIVILDNINSELDKIVKHKFYRKEKIFLHVHPFLAAYLNQGIPSIRMKWFLKYNKWIQIIPRDAFFYLEFRFLDINKKLIRIK